MNLIPSELYYFYQKAFHSSMTSKFSHTECKNVTMVTYPSSSGYNRWPSVLGESLRTVMHHASVVVTNPERIDFRFTSLIEVMLHSYKFDHWL